MCWGGESGGRSARAPPRTRTAHSDTMVYSCPKCGIAQDRAVPCQSCKVRAKVRWCLFCGRCTTTGNKWRCNASACGLRLAACEGGVLSEHHKGLAKEGFLSVNTGLETRPLLAETLRCLRLWTRKNTLATGVPKQGAILHPTTTRRYVLAPTWRGADWDSFFHAVTPGAWRDAMISIMGPCWVTAVALPLVLPGADAQDLHVDSRLPPLRTYNLAVQLDEDQHQGPETRLTPRSHGQGWTTGMHFRLLPPEPPHFAWAERRAEAPVGDLLLWDAAAVHGGPGRPLGGATRDSVLIFSIDGALSEADAATLEEDAGPRRLRIPVRPGGK